MFNSVVTKQTAILEKEISDLKREADELSKGIAILTTKTAVEGAS